MLFYLSRGSSRKGGAMVTALASHQCSQDLNSIHHIWVEFVVTSLPCSLTYFSGNSGFPLSKSDISKFQFDLERTNTF